MEASSLKHDRPTIGILTGRSILRGNESDQYRLLVLRGIQSAAKIKKCNIVVSWGIRPFIDINHIFPAWSVVSSESDFIPVGPWNMDGLIAFTPLGDEDRSLYLQKLLDEGYPVLFIATGESGPTISVNNEVGIRQAVAHLVHHGHRRIAFIAGIPSDPGDSAVRLKAYHAAMAKYNLEADPRLVEWGWHYPEGGYQATQNLLASSAEFTAIVASNDNSAIGAMEAIRDAGLHIPADIAVIGFDDSLIAAAQVPSLTSVHVPLGLIGEQALVSMLDHLLEQAPLLSTQIPTRLIQRQSCGCTSAVTLSAFMGIQKAEPVSVRSGQKSASLQNLEHQIVEEMLDVLPAELRYPGGDEIRSICTTLIEAFYKSLDETNPIYFQTTFAKIIRELEAANGSLEPWQEIISTLRREMSLLPLQWGDVEIRQFAEDLLHQARVVVGESTQRLDKRHEYQRLVNARDLSDLTTSLSAALNDRQAIDLMNSHLAKVGIRHIKVMYFEAEGDDPVAWSIVLDADKRKVPQRFLSRQFPPPGLYPADELLNIILMPLVFQEEVFGYAAIEANNPGSGAAIALQLGATIKVARLHTQVVELSLTDSLTGLHNRRSFEYFLKNEVSRTQRFSRNLSIIAIDLDNFKEYNDSYGHPAGDEALQALAKCLAITNRSADIVARIGGDEFVVVLPETDLSGGLRASRRIRGAVVALSGLKRPLSVSMGVTAQENSKTDAKTLIQQADHALYESKRTGKNRISIFADSAVIDEDDFHPVM